MYITKLLNGEEEIILYHLSKAYGYKAFNTNTSYNSWEDRLTSAMLYVIEYLNKHCTDDERKERLLSWYIEDTIRWANSKDEILDNAVFDRFLYIVSWVKNTPITYHLMYGEDAITGISSDPRFQIDEERYSWFKYYRYLLGKGYSKEELRDYIVEIDAKDGR